MNEKFLDRLIDLLKVKSIITIMTFIAFIYLSVQGKVDIDNFMLILGMISTYFFNKDKNSNI